jgi:hypothetical protein
MTTEFALAHEKGNWEEFIRLVPSNWLQKASEERSILSVMVESVHQLKGDLIWEYVVSERSTVILSDVGISQRSPNRPLGVPCCISAVTYPFSHLHIKP